MELNRRNFISLMVGGVAGMHITPLPWKLTDDIAIWTQNWPWVPVPPAGAFNSAKSVCTLCPGGCGIEVRKVDGRAVKIEGRTDFPVNPGGICPVGMGGLQLLYNEDIRFTRPMKRVGPRGAGQFADISWKEAVGILSERIGGLRKKGAGEAIAAIDGNSARSATALLVERLLKAVGSPNYLRAPSLDDTYSLANLMMLGTDGPMAYDLENSDFILSFGAGLIEGWGAPGRMINAWSIWRDQETRGKVKVVQVEARASNTASKADQWVAVMPGTEGALALAMAHVIIKEGLYNKEFVGGYTSGFNEWSSFVIRQYSPEQAAAVTSCPSEEIRSLARAFAKSKAPVALCGRGKGTLNGSLYESMCIQSLNALTGGINRIGGVLVQDHLPLASLPDITYDEVSRQGVQKARLDHAGTPKFPYAQSVASLFAKEVREAADSRIDTLLVFGSNPVQTLPDGGLFRKALSKIPFIVSFSSFRDDTSMYADLVLPDHTYLEKMDEVVWPAGLQYPLYSLTRPVVKPLYETKNCGDTIIELAKAIGGSVAASFPWKGFEDVVKHRAKGLFDSAKGLTGYKADSPVWKMMQKAEEITPDYKSFDDLWNKLSKGGFWYRPVHNYGRWDSIFKTATGKFEFVSTRLQLAIQGYLRQNQADSALSGLGIGAGAQVAAYPHYEETNAQVDTKVYPITLVPYEMINLASGSVASPPHLNKTIFDNQLLKEDSFAEINPKTASQLGIKEGEPVFIESAAGRIRVRVSIFEGAMPGCVFVPLGFGRIGWDEFTRGKGANPNDIILPRMDPVSGQPVWWKTPVKITKA